MLLLRHVARRPHCQTRLVLIDNHPEEMTRSKLWLPFVCCFLLTRLAAQTAGPEDLYIHFNKSFYVSGEHIWAKVYFLGPLPEEASAVVYLDLIAPDGTVLVSDRLRRTGKYALWDRQIPYEWPSAYYLVRVYTRWNLQFGNDFVYTELLPIYHFPDEPVERPDEWGATKQGEAPAGPAGSGGLQIELLPLRETARSGEEVTLEFRVTDQAGRPVDASLSASVLDLDWLPEEADRPYRLADIWQRGRPEAKPGGAAIPSEKTLVYRGRASDPDSGEPLSTNYLSVHTTPADQYFLVKCRDGAFEFSLPLFEGPQVVQLHDLNPFQPAIVAAELEETAAPVLDYQLLTAEPVRTPAIDRYLYLLRKQRKLRELFDVPLREYPVAVPGPLRDFEPNVRYRIENYQAMEDIEEFLNEIILRSRIEREGERISLKLYNPKTKRLFPNSVWFWIDGYLTPDARTLFDLPLSAIDRLELFTEKETIISQFEPTLAGAGVMAVFTKDRELPLRIREAPNNLDIEGLHRPAAFDPVVPGPDDAWPDLRPVVHWAPELQSGTDGRMSFTFRATSAVGRLLLQVEGVSTEGLPGVLRAVVEVRR